MCTLVIGGSGFVGTNLIRLLVQSDYKISNLDKSDSLTFPELTQIADVRSLSALSNKINKKVQTIVLLAAEHKDNINPVSLYYDVNVEGTSNVLATMEKKGINSIIFTSSVAVYGLNKPNPNEEYPVDPFNDYGKSKWQAEQLLKQWFEKDPQNRSVTIIRPTVIFGEQNRGNVYNLLKQIASGKFIMIGNGNNNKSMAYVGNLAAFIKYCLDNNQKGYHIYNYVDKPDLTMKELVGLVRKRLNKKSFSIHIPYFIGYVGGSCLDIISKITTQKFSISAVRVKKFCATTQFNAQKMLDLGFKPPYSLEEGLGRTVDYEFKSKISSTSQVFYSE